MGEYLRRMGHRKVLCIADNRISMDWERYQGLLEGLYGQQGDITQIQTQTPLMVVPMDEEKRYRFYMEHLEEICRYTAVFAVSDEYAVDLMHFLQKQGIAVPETISVAGFDDIPLSRRIWPALTTIRQDGTYRAKMALEMLGELKRGEGAGRTAVLPVELVERDSVRNMDRISQNA